ncbi:EAL domain-containing protein [Spongiibacter sp. KMU-158]|uniref:EAL domain-containing protein n=1 Tax=Spongiibacter pelagi TaxID=2760804 RepID=A0A927GVT1_9GAMM|nr:EAL domain-containing protein [Spongiibacter pelagi]MBD2858991.1 EAL domain-containing protein [Spongiibacter pelagi]
MSPEFDAERILKHLQVPLVCFNESAELCYLNNAALALLTSSLDCEELQGLSLSSLFSLRKDSGDPLLSSELIELSATNNMYSVHLVNGNEDAGKPFLIAVSKIGGAETAAESEADSESQSDNENMYLLCLHEPVFDGQDQEGLISPILDPLTELFDRREFERRLDNLVDDAAISSRTHALVFLDVDQFKMINDTRGHRAGDNLIKQLAMLLQSEVCHGDTVCRLGGDEFGVLLSNVDAFEARSVASRLLRATKQMEFVWQGTVHSISFSAGVVLIDEHSLTREKVMSQADVAVYSAKEEGRGRVHIYNPEDNKLGRLQEDMHAVQAIRCALENHDFFLVKEGIYSLDAGEPKQSGTYLELLLRMRRGNEVLSPAAFMPAAERFGMMPSIDRWVFAELISYLEAHPELHGQDLLYSINLSGQSLCEKSFLEFVIRKLQVSNIDVRQICFEITETVAIRNFDLVTDFISRVQAMGGRFALDDFGTGMSSFGYLQQLPVDFVKIDGMFVRDMDRNSVHSALVRSINEVSHELGKRTIAEFVERPEIIDCLKSLGVDFFQGHLCGKPVPLHEPEPHLQH